MKNKRKLILFSMIIISLSITTACGNKSMHYDSYAGKTTGVMNDFNESNFGNEVGFESEESAISDDYKILAIDELETNNVLTKIPLNVKVIKKGNMTVETTCYDKTIREINDLMQKNEGFIFSLSSDGELKDRTSKIVVKIPITKFDDFMSEKIENGNVIYSNILAQDITAEYVDTENRIKSLQTRHAKLLELMEKATKLEDMFTIEKELANVNYELENYKGTLSNYDSLTQYSTISIDVYEVEQITELEEDYKFITKLKSSLKNTFNASIISFQTTLILCINLFIFAIFLIVPPALLILLTVFVIRKIIKKNKSK